jgi:hypothetical protein
LQEPPPDQLQFPHTMSSISPSGRNSWSRGSSKRIVTGRPEIANMDV